MNSTPTRARHREAEAWTAPAKTNLSLRVHGRRPDGYHEIETRMVRLALADRIEAGPRDAGEGLAFACDAPDLPTGDGNLVVRAVRALEEASGHRFDVALRLEKRIPAGAGLGGGSSDAAAVLTGLNRWLPRPIDRAALAELASGIGADVPFFLHGSTCDCTGTGTDVHPVSFPVRLRLLLVKPPFGVPTPWAYSRWSDSRPLAGADYAEQTFSWGSLVNDLERPVFEKFLVLAHLKSWLRARDPVEGALLSGSGATVFAVLRPDAGPAEIEALRAGVRDEFGPTFWSHETETIPDPAV